MTTMSRTAILVGKELKEFHPNGKANSNPLGVPTRFNKYTRGDLLADGASAWVFAGSDELLDEPVAIKVLKPEMTASAETVERFKWEAVVGRKLEHPNIVRVHDLNMVESHYYIIMELLSGLTIAKVMETRGQLCENTVLCISKDIVNCLSYMAEMGYIHRDIKPSNIHLSCSNNVKVVDFGLAKLIADQEEVNPQLTSEFQTLGTPYYMSPEQIIDSSSLDIRSDMYSLGVCMFQMLSNQMPFDGDTTREVFTAHLTLPPPDISEIRSSVSPRTTRLVRRLLEKKPDNRYSNYKELGEEIESCIAEYNEERE